MTENLNVSFEISFRQPRAQILSDEELFSVFPEAAEIIPQKITELREQRKIISKVFKNKLAEINKLPDAMSRWFWCSWLNLNEGEKLIMIDKHISRLNRQLRKVRGLPLPRGTIKYDLIKAAREVPIESILDQQFKHSGRTLVGLCPFHDERTPSFHIYLNQNRGWCFGCNDGGDVISLVMKLNKCNFKEAVLQLAEVNNE